MTIPDQDTRCGTPERLCLLQTSKTGNQTRFDHFVEDGDCENPAASDHESQHNVSKLRRIIISPAGPSRRSTRERTRAVIEDDTECYECGEAVQTGVTGILTCRGPACGIMVRSVGLFLDVIRG